MAGILEQCTIEAYPKRENFGYASIVRTGGWMDFEQQLVPAPWRLTGNAHILLYNLSREYIRTKAFVPASLMRYYLGGPAAWMLVTYTTSDVGSYHELLFIPGRFRVGDHSGYSITRIYVSSEVSAVNGRVNWGLPKRVARFEILPGTASRTKSMRVLDQEALVLEADFEHSWLAFPIWLNLIPFSLLQMMDSRLYLTRLQGNGSAHFSRLLSFTANPNLFPDLQGQVPMAAFALNHFTLHFLPADIIRDATVA
jgi:hypothetical protein